MLPRSGDIRDQSLKWSKIDQNFACFGPQISLGEQPRIKFMKSIYTRNTLDCDQSNYSSRIVFSQIPIEFGQTGISAILSADPENPILEPNTE